MRRLSMLAGALVLAAVPALSHDHATGVVKERMEMMETMGRHMEAIRRRVRTKRELTRIKADAEIIAGHAPHIPHLFPKGSTQKPTEARDTIWQNWSDFERLAATLETESKKLASVSASDHSALQAQSRTVWATCNACHDKYRRSE